MLVNVYIRVVRVCDISCACSLQVWVECGGVRLGPMSVCVLRVCIVCLCVHVCMCVCLLDCVCVYECYVCMIIVVPALSAGLGGVWRSDAGSCECVCCVCVYCVFLL